MSIDICNALDSAMAAIEMADGASKVFSPIIMSGILNTTVDTVPSFLFYVHVVSSLSTWNVSNSLLIASVHVGCYSN